MRFPTSLSHKSDVYQAMYTLQRINNLIIYKFTPTQKTISIDELKIVSYLNRSKASKKFSLKELVIVNSASHTDLSITEEQTS